MELVALRGRLKTAGVWLAASARGTARSASEAGWLLTLSALLIAGTVWLVHRRAA